MQDDRPDADETLKVTGDHSGDLRLQRLTRGRRAYRHDGFPQSIWDILMTDFQVLDFLVFLEN